MMTLRLTLPYLLLVPLLVAGGCAEDEPGEDDGAGTDAADDDDDDGDGTAGDDGDGDGDDTAGPADDGTWTVFVYGHADHNLSPSLVADMLEMSAANLGDDLTVIVAADWDASLEGYASGTEWYRIVGGGGDPELLETVDEQDLDDPAVLQAAISRAFTDYPAEHYGLVMWNHGGAWEGGFGGDSANGTDYGPGISGPVLATAIGDALDDVGAERLRFLSFDTCLMAGVEVLAELASLTELYIANAEIDYGAGWDYENTLTWIAEHPDADITELAAAEAEIWDAHHATMGPEDALLRSHASIDAAAIPAFVDAFALFSDAFLQSPAAAGESVGRGAYFALPGYFAESIATLAQAPNLRDVLQFLGAMTDAEDPALADAASTAMAALDDAVLQTINGSLRAPLSQIGVHIELPPATEVEWRLDRYAELAPRWVEQTGWDAGLTGLAELADTTAPIVTTDLETEPGTLIFFAEGTDVAAADIQLAAFDEHDDTVRVLGLIGSGAIDPGFEYGFSWEGSLLQIGAGDQAQFASVFPFARLGLTEDDAVPLLAVPGLLVGSGEELEAVLPFQVGDTEADAIVIEDEWGQTAVIPLEYAYGYQFIPVIPELSAETGEVTLGEGTPLDIPASGGLPLDEAPAPAGDYMLVTTVFDVWGNSEPVVDPVVIP